MTKTVFSLIVAFVCTSCSSQNLQGVLNQANQVLNSGGTGLSNDEVISGLKQALEVGAQKSVDFAGKDGGFWNDARIKIPFPPEAEKVKTTLTGIGMTKQVEDFERTMNKAAETAVKEAVPVFVDAIKGMSVQDGFAILKGEENAATTFLRQRTGDVLSGKFRPIVEKATDQVALTSYWTPLANGYNSAAMFTGGKAVDPDLNAYVTAKAIDGLFTLIAEQEMKIRKDPLARTTDLLKRVFGQP
ncbi:MAG: DUF4197 domain-containing protein [Flavobacteriales bacterium]|nr:DUF4197 domain-containing protein [Flavobacteriales bacterium]MBK7086273.1 DUF4197 domain-containing protein [Flavobacteriales bacterium]MBK7752344.1 DUF4197 domain-containing protein [Flavobacteriales bacterium]MBK9075404.1 DUF4197 domain-containing protein [Flavobacteriales bacterium]MBK9537707.1 DUF4197 domain-containing protein [Flavobacteriales bacterium]